MTSWYGDLPMRNNLKSLLKNLMGKSDAKILGIENRGIDYRPLSDSEDDARIPWYLYWEIYWVAKNGPQIKSNMRILDAGGTSSLFSCYLASLGCEVHSIDINEALVANAEKIAKTMSWNIIPQVMNMKNLSFENEYFDHAYSICVFEHLDYEIKQLALAEIARCLKPNGSLSITFDYRNPAPFIAGHGPDTRDKNRISIKEDMNVFSSSKYFTILGNKDFYDNGNSYLVNPSVKNIPYTFGAIFLRKNSF
jgi:SAM-dependent methyltransferase